jgi:hypothetical protein
VISEITGWDEKRAVKIRDEEEAGTTATKVAALCAKQKGWKTTRRLLSPVGGAWCPLSSLSLLFVFSFVAAAARPWKKQVFFEDEEQRGGVSCDDDDLCHDEYSIVVVVFVNLKICETLCCV